MALRSVARITVAPRGGRYELRLVLGRRTTRALVGGPNAVVVRWTPEPPNVRIEVFAAGEIDQEGIDRALATAIGIAGLDDDPTGFAEVAKNHPTVERLYRKYAGTRLGRTATVFETFATGIIQQLVTYEEASASIRRLIYRYGAKVEGTDLVAFPVASAVAAIPPHDLRAMGVGIRRATTLRTVAARGASLERLREHAPEEAIARMTSLRGIGVWTATKVAIEAMGYADGILLRDAVLPFVMTMALTGNAGGDEELAVALEPFRPHRARVTQLIGIAHLLDHQVPGVPRKPLPQIDPHRRRPWEG
jgi:3-methyladenine DNA glycosylase/8-oxoguanine DNA glycosylase